MVGGTWEQNGFVGTWELNGDVLEFWGEGYLQYTAGSEPWVEYRSEVKRVIVHEGITKMSVGNLNLPQMESIDLPNTLQTLTGSVSYTSNLRELVIPDSVTLVGNDPGGLLGDVLPSSGVLERIVVGSGVQRIGGRAFSSCPSVKELVFRGPMPEFLGYTFIGSTVNYDNLSFGTSDAPANVVVYSKGWASDEVLTTAIRGSYTTFEYRRLTYNITPSAIPVRVKGYFRRSHFRVNVKGVVKSKVMAWVNKKGKWIPIDDSYEGEHIPSVTFNANGGTGTMASITGSTATLPANGFSLSGYVFNGWNTSPDGSGTAYSVGQTITVSSDLTLYAIWIRQYTVGFNANGGTGTVASIVTTGTTATIPANAFTRSKHRFDRWNTKADGSGTSYTAGQTITLSDDMTLYAIWVQQVTVTYYKSWNAGSTTIFPPGSNSGPIGKDGDSYYYLNLQVGGVTVPYLSDAFTASGNNSPTRTLTVDKGTSLYVSARDNLTGSNCQIYDNGSQVSSGSLVTYSLPGGIQSDVTVQMVWGASLSYGVVPTKSYWLIGITGGK